MNIGQFVCGGGSADETINTSVRTIASAVAEVVSEVEYDCTLEGDSTATAAVTSLGESRADAVGTAISRVILDVSACMSCMGAARSVVNVTSMLAAEATLDNLFTVRLLMLGNGLNISSYKRLKGRSHTVENRTLVDRVLLVLFCLLRVHTQCAAECQLWY